MQRSFRACCAPVSSTQSSAGGLLGRGGREAICNSKAASWERTELAERASGPEAEAPDVEEKIGSKGQEGTSNCLRIWGTGRQVRLGFSVRM